MTPATQSFKENAAAALADPKLAKALSGIPGGLVAQRTAAKGRVAEFEALREAARSIRDHTLAHLDLYLEMYERKVADSGGRVHYALNAADARAIVLKLCQEANAKRVTKGKSMVSEEIGLNAHLQASGVEVVETDLLERPMVAAEDTTPRRPEGAGQEARTDGSYSPL